MVASTTGTTLSPGTMPHYFLRHRENMQLKIIATEDPNVNLSSNSHNIFCKISQCVLQQHTIENAENLQKYFLTLQFSFYCLGSKLIRSQCKNSWTNLDLQHFKNRLVLGLEFRSYSVYTDYQHFAPMPKLRSKRILQHWTQVLVNLCISFWTFWTFLTFLDSQHFKNKLVLGVQFKSV